METGLECSPRRSLLCPRLTCGRSPLPALTSDRVEAPWAFNQPPHTHFSTSQEAVQYLEEGPGQGIERLVVQEADQQPQDGPGGRGVLQVECELKGGAQALNLRRGGSG